MEFEAFPKIPRLNRDVIVTEKIDGTNAAVILHESGAWQAQSRKQLITPENDNFGFAKWVQDHASELFEALGPGRHFGEWWGRGIQRGYGLDHKRFSLFNTTRWAELEPTDWGLDVVPVLHYGPRLDHNWGYDVVSHCLDVLRGAGSRAAPGFMRPEGIILFHTAANSMFKVTLENDEKPKGEL